MRFAVFASLVLFACDPLKPEPPPDVIVLVPAPPMPEPEALPPPAPAPPPRIIGSFHGVPIPEHGPWTRTLPRPNGSFSASGVSRSPARFPHRPLSYEAGHVRLHGTYALTVADGPTDSPLVRVELKVKSGRVRVFLKYLGDIYFTLDAAPGTLGVLEGAGIPGHGTSLTVWFEALDGTAELESVSITSVKQLSPEASRPESPPP